MQTKGTVELVTLFPITKAGRKPDGLLPALLCNYRMSELLDVLAVEHPAFHLAYAGFVACEHGACFLVTVELPLEP